MGSELGRQEEAVGNIQGRGYSGHSEHGEVGPSDEDFARLMRSPAKSQEGCDRGIPGRENHESRAPANLLFLLLIFGSLWRRSKHELHLLNVVLTVVNRGTQRDQTYRSINAAVYVPGHTIAYGDTQLFEGQGSAPGAGILPWSTMAFAALPIVSISSCCKDFVRAPSKAVFNRLFGTY